MDSSHKKNGYIIRRMLADGLSLDQCASYLNITADKARSCLMFTEINDSIVVSQKRKNWPWSNAELKVELKPTNSAFYVNGNVVVIRDKVSNLIMGQNGDTVYDKMITFNRMMEKQGGLK